MARSEVARGISTFAHLLSDEEIAMLRELSLAKNGELDPAINSVIHALCKRGFVDGEAEGEDVDFSNSLKSALSEESPEGSKIRLEQKTKFWEAERIGTSVHVVYGKKNSKGQSNVHNAASIEAAKDYFEKKVHEKRRGGYKAVDVVASVKKTLLEKLFADKESASKKVKQVPRHRADFDKCCELLTFLTAHALNRPKVQDEMFGSLFGKGTTLGSDVCYGPVFLINAAAVASVGPQILSLQVEAVLEQFKHVDQNECFGGLTGCTRERESEYVAAHFKNLQGLVREALDQNLGLLLHFW